MSSLKLVGRSFASLPASFAGSLDARPLGNLHLFLSRCNAIPNKAAAIVAPIIPSIRMVFTIIDSSFLGVFLFA